MARNLQQLSDEDLCALLNEDKHIAIAAFDEIYDRYSSNIYTYCHKVMSNSSVADDIFQDTFAKFFESTKKNKEVVNLNGFLIKIARNLCINEKNRKYNENVPLEEFQFPVYDNSYANKELTELLETALEALPEDFKEVLIMKEYMDMTYKEIAEATDNTLSNVRIRIYRAKNKLRDIMAPYIKDLNSK